MVTKAEFVPTKIEGFFHRLLEKPRKHALFLNTVSLLEHMGSRKILMTQSHENTPELVLNHASEEARHALFFKRKISKLDPQFRPTYKNNELLAGISGKIYFQRLDAMVKRNLSLTSFQSEKNRISFLNYLYTTTLIELRAMEVYETYDRILEEKSIGFRLTSIIKEEEGHLKGMNRLLSQNDPDYETRLSGFREKEKIYFNKFLGSLEKEIAD